ncbi:MAG: hypothetical protein PHU46_15045 [Rhodocyclaceae bacterium]|nr:hypothetical protein [Rhodocyclaceae bacterium]
MTKNRNSSFGYFRLLLVFSLAGIAWFIYENGADILLAGGVTLHEKKPKLSMPILKSPSNEMPERTPDEQPNSVGK